jgi:hypothetical protein
LQVPIGGYTVTAQYRGDNNNAAAWSNSIVQVVSNVTGITYPPVPAGTLYEYSITPPGGSSGYAPNGNLLSYTD